MIRDKLRDVSQGGDFDEVRKRVQDEYPIVYRAISSFISNPLSGDTFEMLVKGEDAVIQDQQSIRALKQPVMWNHDAPIVISQCGGYGSERLTTFWNTTLPDIEKKYGSNIRYEHYDAPILNQRFTEYKLATAGRTIQHECGDDAFWLWFNSIMVRGVQSMTDAYKLIDELNIDVTGDEVKDSVDLDLYEGVLSDDVRSLLDMCDEESEEKVLNMFDNGDSVFTVFVNGVETQPTYGAMVGEIERNL